MSIDEQLNTSGERYTLRPEEKARMREVLHAAMAYNPSRGTSKRSPYTFWYIHRTASVFASVGVLLVLMSGTAYAAEGSLPGDVLYPIKIHVTEPLAVTLAPTPAAKAEVETAIAQRRAAEAERLAASGTLTPVVSAELGQNVTEHTKAAVALINTVSQDDKTRGVQLSTELNASLAAHADILSGLADAQKNASTKEASRTVVAALADRSQVLAVRTEDTHPTTLAVSSEASSSDTEPATSAPIRTMALAPAHIQSNKRAATSASSTATTSLPKQDGIPQKDIESLTRSVELTLSDAEDTLASENPNSTTSIRAKERISQIRQLISETQSSDKQKEDVSETLQTALGQSVILRTHLDAAKQFKGFEPDF